MTTEVPSTAPAPKGRDVARLKRIALAIGMALMLIAILIIQFRYLPAIKSALSETEVLLTDRANDEPWYILGATVRPDPLDTPFVKLEIPRNEAEFLALTPPSTHREWQGVLYVDYLLILGYVVFFLALPLGTREDPTLWEQIGFCGIMAGIADCVENLAIALLIGNIVQDLRLGDAAMWIGVLTVFGALKWLFFFVACRAICIELEQLLEWRWLAVWLRATSTVGSWAALLALIGLPSRPILTLMAYASVLLIATIGVKRLRGDAPGERVPAEWSERLESAG